MANGFIGFNIEAHQPMAWMFLALDQRLLADEIIGLGLKRYRKPNARFEGISLRGELVIGKDQARLNAHHVQGLEAHGL